MDPQKLPSYDQICIRAQPWSHLLLSVNGLDAKFKASIAKRYEAERGSGDTEERRPGHPEDTAEGQFYSEIIKCKVGWKVKTQRIVFLNDLFFSLKCSAVEYSMT